MDHPQTALACENCDTSRPLRAVVFTLLAALMFAGPFCRQVLGLRTEAVRAWMMFRATGLGLADVRFSKRERDGTLVPLDHYATLGYERWREAPLGLRRIRGLEGVQRVAGKLCEALGDGADLRARVRIAHPTGWRTEMVEADGNLCDASRPQ
jgi:hypothetical protein